MGWSGGGEGEELPEELLERKWDWKTPSSSSEEEDDGGILWCWSFLKSYLGNVLRNAISGEARSGKHVTHISKVEEINKSPPLGSLNAIDGATPLDIYSR